MDVISIRHSPRYISSLEERRLKNTFNMSFRLPADTANSLKNLPGTRTEHVVAALDAYIELREKVERDTK